MSPLNDLGQPIGDDLAGWARPSDLGGPQLVGEHVSLRPMSEGDAAGILAALHDLPGEDFTYMAFDKPEDLASAKALVWSLTSEPGWTSFAIDVTGEVAGFAAYLRDKPSIGVVEIGSIMFGTTLQRTTAATEAIYLMLRHAFDSGYRRVEWKCDSLNEPSRRSAERFGFSYEGTFAKATHYKGRNRDTAWYAITDDRWPSVREAFETWLAPGNFDEVGGQIASLRDLVAGAGERT